MEGRLFLNVVIRKSSAILELLAGKDESLLVWRDTFLVLDLGFDILDGVRSLDLKSDGLASESLDEDLHTASKSEDEMEGRLFLDVVIRKSSAVFELLTSEDESLLVWRNSLLVLNNKVKTRLGACFRVRKYDLKICCCSRFVCLLMSRWE